MEPLRKDLSPIKMRNYGRILQDVVAYICGLPEGPSKQALTVYVAQCMRQKNLVWNKDQESGIERVKADIVKISDGRLNCSFPGFDEAFQGGIKKQDNQQPKAVNQPAQQANQPKNKKKKESKNKQ